MKRWLITVLTLVGASPVYAGHFDQSLFFGAPVLGEVGLVALAIGLGLGGARVIRKRRDK